MSALHFPIRVPSEMLEALGEFTGHFWSDTLSLEPFVCEALTNYMNPPPAPEPQSTQASEPSELGYQWKEVFLPEGTKLRASFGRQPYFATVRGAQIKYGEHAVSPSCFANLYGSGNRNAWKAVWLRLPGSDTWLLADTCRAVQKAAMMRMLTGEPQQKTLPKTSSAPAPTPASTQKRVPVPAPVSVQLAALQGRPRQTKAGPPANAPASASGADTRPINIAGKSARRRKRRGKKQTQCASSAA